MGAKVVNNLPFYQHSNSLFQLEVKLMPFEYGFHNVITDEFGKQMLCSTA